MATIPPQDLLPSPERLDALECAIHAFIEEEVQAVTYAVFGAVNYEGEQAVTFEQVGKLATWARFIRSIHLEPLVEHFRNLEKTVLDDLSVIVVEGEQQVLPEFDEHGYRRDPEREYAQMLASRFAKGGKDA